MAGDEIEGGNSAAVIREREIERFDHALLQLGGLEHAGGWPPFEDPRDDLAEAGHVELDPGAAGDGRLALRAVPETGLGVDAHGLVEVDDDVVGLSVFGDLFTVLFAEDLDKATVDETVSVVTGAGFTLLPADELEEPYTGSNPRLTGMSWFTRFFCYL